MASLPDNQKRRSTGLVDPATAEQTLADQYSERLRLFAMRRLGDLSAADDVAQETLGRVAAALRDGRVQDIAALPGFVFRTATHVCLQHLRSLGRESRALSRLAADPSERTEPDDPLTTVISEERRAEVRTALARLDVADRDLLHLLYFERVETAAAAVRLALTAEALRVRKHRALRRLAAILEEPGSNDRTGTGTS